VACLELSVLSLDEFLLLVDVLLDFLEKQVDGLSLVLLNLGQSVQEPLDVGRRSDLDVVLLALVEQEGELSLRLLALFDLGRVWQVVGRFFLVEVDELGQANVAKLVHDVPSIVLWNCELIETHGLRSAKQG